VKNGRRFLAASSAVVFALCFRVTTALASSSSGINNPLAGSTGNIASATNHLMGYVLDAATAITGGVCLFNLYLAIAGLAAGSRHAQRREEAKGHFMWAAITLILCGLATYLSGALFNFGRSV